MTEIAKCPFCKSNNVDIFADDVRPLTGIHKQEADMTPLLTAYHEVLARGLDASPEGVAQIIRLGLSTARQRINDHEDYLVAVGEKDEPQYI